METFGPAMLALTPLRRDFVLAYMKLGSANASKAYKLSHPGCGSEKAARSNASVLLRDPKVRAAILEEANENFTTLLPLAQEKLTRLLTNQSHPDHWKAVRWIQEVQGRTPVQRSEKTVQKVVEHRLSVDELRKRVRDLSERHGVTHLIEHKPEEVMETDWSPLLENEA